MCGAVTSHDGYAGTFCFVKIDLHALRTELLEEELLLLGKKKLKGSPVVVSVATVKVEGRR